MRSVRITSVGVAHPTHRISQEDAARQIAAVSGDARRVRALAKGTMIDGRAIALLDEAIGCLGSIEERNDLYRELAPRLAAKAASNALLQRSPGTAIGFLSTSSCTGYMVPGLDVDVAVALQLGRTTARLPITEAGCAGGVVAISRAADFLRVHEAAGGLAVACEICSLAFHPDDDIGNLTSTLIFGDGAGAALLESDREPGGGLEIVDSLSLLVPCSRDALGFRLTDQGFYPELTRELADLLPEPVADAVSQISSRNNLGSTTDIGYWLIHPGGPKILRGIEAAFGLTTKDLRWSWQSLREFGNTSSAAIFDVLRRYLEDADAPKGWGIVMAFGPGVSIELLLVHRC